MEIIIKDWLTQSEDHLWLEETIPSDYISTPNCLGCNIPLDPISIITNKNSDIGLITGLCLRCGHVQRIQNLSSDWYSHHFSKNWLAKRDELFVEDHTLFNTIKPYLPANGKVLDLGCGMGTRLLPFQHAGFDVYGVDPSETRSSKGAELMKNIRTGNGEDYLTKTEDMFDVIYLHNVVQFVANPFKILRLAGEKLNNGGILYLKFGRFYTNSNFCNLAHLGVIRSYPSLYGFKPHFQDLGLNALYYKENPYEIVLKKGNSSATPIVSMSNFTKVTKTQIKQNIIKTLNIRRLKIFKNTIIKFQNRKVHLKLSRNGKDLIPVTFIHEKSKIPILLK